jgi:hypothetical protein
MLLPERGPVVFWAVLRLEWSCLCRAVGTITFPERESESAWDRHTPT